MRDLFSVFKFEFLNRLKQKSIIYTTLIFAVLVLLLTFIPRFFDVFDSSSVDSTENAVENIEENDDLDKIGYAINNNVIDESIVGNLIYFGEPIKYNSVKELEEAVNNEEIESGYYFESKSSFKEIVKNISLYSQNNILVQEGLNKVLRDEQLASEGIDPMKVDSASNQEISFEIVNLGKNGITGFIFAYVGMFIVYMVVLLFGNSVATLVAREKNDRTMEILITNTSAKNLIVGKVFASTLTSFLQLFIIIVAGFLGFTINKSYYPAEIVELLKEGLSFEAIAVFLLFIVLGCLMYFFLYAAFGALVSRVEDVGNATGPIQIIFVASFLVTSFGIQMPESMVMKIASIIPFSSPMSFFVRYTMTEVPIYQMLLSIALLIITTIILAFISIKIYRMGTLNYGNKMGFFKTVTKLFQKQD
ncbi:ABC transporter permease [Miniphocaeibacter halophilus]|uniref:ABC transporter permease n=1 Tax=Miniphocaeibacter halophilus TaxID=2931922 RepID=A0AC61MZ80_9FIRM|nr:ABC transporter permease [Miniphocaeibacter halophilus]QQK08566.1 ABC transporter permease [Miniphocaeibacter halophilus]